MCQCITSVICQSVYACVLGGCTGCGRLPGHTLWSLICLQGNPVSSPPWRFRAGWAGFQGWEEPPELSIYAHGQGFRCLSPLHTKRIPSNITHVNTPSVSLPTLSSCKANEPAHVKALRAALSPWHKCELVVRGSGGASGWHRPKGSKSGGSLMSWCVLLSLAVVSVGQTDLHRLQATPPPAGSCPGPCPETAPNNVRRPVRTTPWSAGPTAQGAQLGLGVPN